jgi:hypothetical protein
MIDEQVFAPVDYYVQNEHYRPVDAFYPSNASCKVGDEIYGKCLRYQYYLWKGEKQAPMTYRGWMATELGKGYEAAFLKSYKKLGLLRGTNWPVRATIMGLKIRGRLDGYTKEGQIIECKSAYGKAFFNSIRYKPKMDHLCQIILYMAILGADECILPYGCRDNSGSRIGYRIRKYEIEAEGIYVISILARWKHLQRCLENNTPPDRDFQLDWHCSYCSYMRKCWSQKELDEYFNKRKGTSKTLSLVSEQG